MVAKNKAGERIADQILAGQQVSHAQSFDALLKWFTASHADWEIVAVGHRVVHGGERYSQPTIIDDRVLDHLTSFIPLAPLHQPHNVAGIIALQALLPKVSQIACFDTAFHRSQPQVAQAFGLPRALTAEGIKRYGFHGLSYEFIARALPQHSTRADRPGRRCPPRQRRQHGGHGRPQVPGHHPRLLDHRRSGDGHALRQSRPRRHPAPDGNQGPRRQGNDQDALQGIRPARRLRHFSQDMRTLLASDKPEAQEAVDLFCYRIVRELGSLAAAAGGLDALVFTGGIGEHAAEVRRRVCLQLEWLGIRLNPEANARHELHIGAGNSSVDVLVIPTNEEWMMAHHAQTLLAL
jgi:acetate kinase